LYEIKKAKSEFLMNSFLGAGITNYTAAYTPSSLPLVFQAHSAPIPQQAQTGKSNVSYLLAPGFELITAMTFLLNIPVVTKQTERILKKLPENLIAKFLRQALPVVSNPRTSNRLLLATALMRSLFNSSIGINQEQAGMVITNVASFLFNVPLMIMMELAVHRNGTRAAHKYSKILALVNLMLTGLFTTGFVQKARRDNGETYYTHDMRNFKELFDRKNGLTFAERLKRGSHEMNWLIIDSVKAYDKAWQEVCHSFSGKENFQAFSNPVNPQGSPGRIAFSAFTMPLGALIALVNVKSNPRISLLAAAISILGNLENGLALSLTSWKDKKQPMHWFGVLGGLASPVAEAVLTSKSSLGPALMTSSNAFQNLYQATAWADLSDKQKDANETWKNIVLNKSSLRSSPES
jgi:hypothetical protein